MDLCLYVVKRLVKDPGSVKYYGWVSILILDGLMFIQEVENVIDNILTIEVSILVLDGLMFILMENILIKELELISSVSILVLDGLMFILKNLKV